jgi:hypothetical protein
MKVNFNRMLQAAFCGMRPCNSAIAVPKSTFNEMKPNTEQGTTNVGFISHMAAQL